MRPAILWLTDKTFWLTSAEFTQSAYGKRVFEDLFGSTFFDYWEKNADQPEGFDEGQASLSKIENEFILKNYTFPENIIVADIAGGLGNLLLEVLARNPSLKGILFDRKHVLEKIFYIGSKIIPVGHYNPALFLNSVQKLISTY